MYLTNMLCAFKLSEGAPFNESLSIGKKPIYPYLDVKLFSKDYPAPPSDYNLQRILIKLRLNTGVRI